MKETTDAVDILHRRYIGNNPKRKASLQRERQLHGKPAARFSPTEVMWGIIFMGAVVGFLFMLLTILWN